MTSPRTPLAQLAADAGNTSPPARPTLRQLHPAARAFFTDLGLTVLGGDTVSGEWTDTAVGLDGNHAEIAVLQTPDGGGRLELFEHIHPEGIETEPTRPNEIGMRRVAFSVDGIDEALVIAARHGCYPLRGVTARIRCRQMCCPAAGS